MADNKVIIDIDVEGNAADQLKKIENRLKDFEQTAEESFSGASRFFANFAANLASQAVVSGFKAITKGAKTLFKVFITDGIKAAIAQEDAINELNIALKASGKFSEEASKELQLYSEQLQANSKFADETILSVSALIQSVGQLEKDALKRATKAAVDLSAALGIDLRAAAVLVGKAATGEASSFSRYGIVIKKAATDAKTFEKALTALEQKFGGAAAGQVKTFSGAIAQLKNTFRDLTETTGAAITGNKAIIAVFNEVNKIIGETNNDLKENEDAIQSFVSNSVIALIEGFRGVIIVFQTVQVSLLKLLKSFVGAQGVVSSATDALTFGLTSAGENAKASAEQFLKLEKSIEEIESGNTTLDKIDEALVRIGNAAKKVAKEVKAIEPPSPERGPASVEVDENAVEKEFDSLVEEAKIQLEAQQQLEIALDKEQAIIDEANFEALVKETEFELVRAEVLADADQKRIDAIFSRNEQILSLNGAANEAEIIANEGKIRAILAQENISARERKAIGDRLAKAEAQRDALRLQAVSSFLGDLSTLQSTNSKELFEIGKAAATAEAFIQAQLAIQRALAAFPPPFNFIAAAGVAVKTAVQISKIQSAQFQPTKAQEGLTEVPGGFPNDSFPARLTSGERVVSAPQNQDLVAFLEQNKSLNTKLDALIAVTSSRKQQIVVNVGSDKIIDVIQDEIDSGRTLRL